MEEGRFHCKVLQAVVVEILSQVGFERASRQALQVIVDLTLSEVAKRLRPLKDALSETQPEPTEKEKEADPWESNLQQTLLKIITEESAGPEHSYRREELLSFLQYQINITKQLKKDGPAREESLLEILRAGDAKFSGKEKKKEQQNMVDFTGEEEGEKKAPEEKKYLDVDVQEHLQERAKIKSEKICRENKIKKIKQIIARESAGESEGLVHVNSERSEFLIRGNMRDYEHMLNRKRLTAQHCTPCETLGEIPFLQDILSLSVIRRVSRRRFPAEDSAEIL
ncbi:uncharacterized protein NEMAJ01_2398 [Nematocida major]|uniref:uncharacterized protein n=1 Tax=Nematocida major TaxID=1912982 RepID=UPI002007E808|nr:uncharacterized protein NEMAJ01_2398 [Nematocida major]KAH9387502.1 hypothetical protein NEMAJ01_2398 [Nematocida major]